MLVTPGSERAKEKRYSVPTLLTATMDLQSYFTSSIPSKYSILEFRQMSIWMLFTQLPLYFNLS